MPENSEAVSFVLLEDTITAEAKTSEMHRRLNMKTKTLCLSYDRGIRCVEVKEVRGVPMERPCVQPSVA